MARSRRQTTSPYQRPHADDTRGTGQANENEIAAVDEEERQENTHGTVPETLAFGTAQEEADAIEEEGDGDVVQNNNNLTQVADVHDPASTGDDEPDTREGNGGDTREDNGGDIDDNNGEQAMKGITEAIKSLSASMDAFAVSVTSAIDEQNRREAGRAKQVQQQLAGISKAIALKASGDNGGKSSGDGSGSGHGGSRGGGSGGGNAPVQPNPPHVTHGANPVTMSDFPSINVHHDAFAHLSNGDARLHQWSNLVKSNTLKPSKPPAFDGDTGKADVFQWANQMDMYVRAFDNPTQQQIFQAILANLSGAAARWAWDRVRVLRASGYTDSMPWDSIPALYADMAAVFHRSDNLTLAYSDYMSFTINGFDTATALRNHIVKVRLDARTDSGMFAQHLMYTVKRDWGAAAASSLANVPAWRRITEMLYQKGAGVDIPAVEWDEAFEALTVAVLDTGTNLQFIGKNLSKPNAAAQRTLADSNPRWQPRQQTPRSAPAPNSNSYIPVYAFFKKFREHHGADKFQQLLKDDLCLNCGGPHRVRDCPSPLVCAMLGSEASNVFANAGLPFDHRIAIACMQVVENTIDETNSPAVDASLHDMDHPAMVAHFQARMAAEQGGDN